MSLLSSSRTNALPLLLHSTIDLEKVLDVR